MEDSVLQEVQASAHPVSLQHILSAVDRVSPVLYISVAVVGLDAN